MIHRSMFEWLPDNKGPNGGNRKGPGGEIVLPILCNPSFYHFVFIYKAPAGI